MFYLVRLPGPQLGFDRLARGSWVGYGKSSLGGSGNSYIFLNGWRIFLLDPVTVTSPSYCGQYFLILWTSDAEDRTVA